MKLIKTKIKGLLIVRSQVYKDKRMFKRSFRKDIFVKTPFDILSYSKKMFWGLHFQSKFPQAKLITVTHGKVLDVAVDLRKNSKTFGKYFSVIISQNDNFSFYIPENFAHGFVCLSKSCTINYRCTKFRNVKYEKTLAWNDPDVNIKWPIKNPILSEKDKNKNQSLRELFNL